MKLFAFILITAALVCGTLSAATAYIPRLDAIDASMALTMNAPAGRSLDDETLPYIDPDASDDDVVLTQKLIDDLRAQDVARVTVKEFAFGRWDGRWMFILSCVGLLLGAGIVRYDAARTIAARLASARAPHETPEHALAEARREVHELRESIEAMSNDEQKSRLIVDILDSVQRTHLDVVGGSAAELTVKLGAGGYAQLMDRFAAAERQLNRAWSAAADGVLEEAVICLEQGEALLAESEQRMSAKT